MKMKQAVNPQRQMQVLNAMMEKTGGNVDLDSLSPEERKNILKERLAQKKYLLGIGRAPQKQKESEVEKLQQKMRAQVAADEEAAKRKTERNRKKRQKKRDKERQRKMEAVEIVDEGSDYEED